jgi:hypothetical protein
MWASYFSPFCRQYSNTFGCIIHLELRRVKVHPATCQQAVSPCTVSIPVHPCPIGSCCALWCRLYLISQDVERLPVLNRYPRPLCNSVLQSFYYIVLATLQKITR